MQTESIRQTSQLFLFFQKSFKQTGWRYFLSMIKEIHPDPTASIDLGVNRVKRVQLLPSFFNNLVKPSQGITAWDEIGGREVTGLSSHLLRKPKRTKRKSTATNETAEQWWWVQIFWKPENNLLKIYNGNNFNNRNTVEEKNRLKHIEII